MNKIRYGVDSKSILTKVIAALMALSILFRIIGCWGFWNDNFRQHNFGYTQMLLPILCALMFSAIILWKGEKYFALTVIPVVLGAVFFIIKATDMHFFPMLLCIAVSLAVAGLYIATLFGSVTNKWPLAAAFGLPILYKIVDRKLLAVGHYINTFGMKSYLVELSLLCIFAAMLLAVITMKKYTDTELSCIDAEIVGDDYIIEDETEDAAALLIEDKKTKSRLEKK